MPATFLLLIFHRLAVLVAQLACTFRRLAGDVLHGNTLADDGGVVRMALRGVDIQIPDEPVVNDKALGFIFARSLHLVHVDMIDTLVSQRYAYCGASHAWPHSFIESRTLTLVLPAGIIMQERQSGRGILRTITF